MKSCPKCSHVNHDSDKFCTGCGTSIDSAPQPAQPQQPAYQPQQQPVYQQPQQPVYQQPQQPVYQQPVYPQQPVYGAPGYIPAPQGSLSSNPIINVVKTIASSPLFLVVAILMSAQVLFSLFSLFAADEAFGGLAALFSEIPGGRSILYNIMGPISNAMMGISFLMQIPSMIICAALWMLYVSAASRTSQSMSPVGLTMIKVVSIINLCFTGLIYVVMLIACIAGMGAASDYGSSEATSVMAVLLFLLLGSAVPVIFYYKGLLTTIHNVRHTIISAQPNANISMYLVVVNYILAGLTVIGSFSSLENSGGFFTFLLALISAGLLVMVNICMTKYKQTMTNMLYQNNPSVPRNY